jgi:hypothetical protein
MAQVVEWRGPEFKPHYHKKGQNGKFILTHFFKNQKKDLGWNGLGKEADIAQGPSLEGLCLSPSGSLGRVSRDFGPCLKRCESRNRKSTKGGGRYILFIAACSSF